MPFLSTCVNSVKENTANENKSSLLTCEEAGEELRQSKQTVWKKCRSGEIPHIRLSPRCYRIRRTDLEQYLSATTR